MVHRGKYSEGYNFKDNLCRTIFMVGVPNQNIQEPKVIMKKIFYKQSNDLLKLSENSNLDNFEKYYARQRN